MLVLKLRCCFCRSETRTFGFINLVDKVNCQGKDKKPKVKVKIGKDKTLSFGRQPFLISSNQGLALEIESTELEVQIWQFLTCCCSEFCASTLRHSREVCLFVHACLVKL